MGIPDWPNRSRRQRSLPNPAEYLPPFVLPILSGTAAFSSVLAASTFVHLKALGISTGSLPPIPTCLGITSVGLASIFSQWVSVKTHEVVHKMGERQPETEKRHKFTGCTIGDFLPNKCAHFKSVSSMEKTA